MADIRMPQVGQDLKTGKIVEWKKTVGQSVAKGEVVAVVESEKAVFDVEAESAGVLSAILHQAGDEVEVMAPIGRLDGTGAPAAPTLAAATATVDIRMPQVGQDLKTGKIVEWKKAVGQTVAKGEVVAVVESEKAVFDVEAEQAGTLAAILHPPGDEVEVMAPIGRMTTSGGPEVRTSERPAASAPVVPPPCACAQAVAPAAIALPKAFGGRVVSSPAARRVARERGVDLAGIRGSGPGGRIKIRDVEAAASSTTPAPAAMVSQLPAQDQVLPFDRMRQAIADRLTKSVQTIPQFFLAIDVDMAASLAWRKTANAQGGEKISVNDLIAHAVAQTLPQFPRLNSHVASDRLTLKPTVNLGIAVALDEGLVVPVLADAQRKDLRTIARETRVLAETARSGKVDPRVAGTFTISNLGATGITRFRAIINPPECAILAVGAATERVVAVDGMIAVRPILTLTLTCDHRAVDGAYAGRFLAAVKMHLESMA